MKGVKIIDFFGKYIYLGQTYLLKHEARSIYFSRFVTFVSIELKLLQRILLIYCIFGN